MLNFGKIPYPNIKLRLPIIQLYRCLSVKTASEYIQRHALKKTNMFCILNEVDEQKISAKLVQDQISGSYEGVK